MHAYSTSIFSTKRETIRTVITKWYFNSVAHHIHNSITYEIWLNTSMDIYISQSDPDTFWRTIIDVWRCCNPYSLIERLIRDNMVELWLNFGVKLALCETVSWNNIYRNLRKFNPNCSLIKRSLNFNFVMKIHHTPLTISYEIYTVLSWTMALRPYM